jgi:hypothetical protein
MWKEFGSNLVEPLHLWIKFNKSLNCASSTLKAGGLTFREN